MWNEAKLRQTRIFLIWSPIWTTRNRVSPTTRIGNLVEYVEYSRRPSFYRVFLYDSFIN
jgi:hypothetical protein